jgi:exosortase A-associated hydrolase 2
LRPLVLPPADAPLFAVVHEPAAGIPVRGSVLLAPPIGEELNRCRLAIANAARAWSRQGWMTLVADLYGTGDSAGDFGDATVERWRDDLCRAWQWLQRASGGEPVLWAVRGGALLALSLRGELQASRVALWAPQFTGREVVDSVLRLATAADALAQRDGQLPARERIRREGVIEIGGYRWSDVLLSSLEALGEGARTLNARDVLWLEPAGRDVRHDPRVSATPQPVANGIAFWRTAEPVAAPAWAEATEDWLRRETS